MSSTQTAKKSKRPRKPSDPRYTPKGKRTARDQRKRRPKKPSKRRAQVRRGAFWTGRQAAGATVGRLFQLVILPVVLPIRAIQRRRAKRKK